MARGKTKQIQKQSKEQKSQSKNQTQVSNLGSFSQVFNQKLQHFTSLTKEILTLKAKAEGTDPHQGITDRRERVSQKIQEASANILKQELQNLQEWIADKQSSLKQEIEKITKAYQESKASLLVTGAFSEAELETHLAAIQQRVDEKKAAFDSYAQLLEKSKNIYSE